MLRTRLFLGLLPLVLAVVATGIYAIRVCRELAGPLQRELVANYRAALGCQDLRASATLMSNTLASTGDPIGARRNLDELETEHIRRILATSRSLEEAARTLGIDPATLYRKRAKLGLL